MKKKDMISRITKKGFAVSEIPGRRIRAQKHGTIITGTLYQVFDEICGCWERRKK